MQTVKIRLRKPTRVFPFLAPDTLVLKRNDACIVRSDRGLEYGTCVLPGEECPPELEERYSMSVVRKATHADDTTYRQLQLDERKAQDLCSQKVAERNLPMKLVDCEYTFDMHKVIFYFTAADRVDFRDLVRDLAHDLKTRIELRHIQVRDEAKLVGGLGVCGRELCCSTWLGEFLPISMKMAKRQNLSLNPSKISGQCGRLLCCLSYENDLYQTAKKARADKPVEVAPDPGLAVEEEEYPWQEPMEEVASVVTDERIHGRAPKIEDEEGHASSVVDIDGDEEDALVIDTGEEGIEATVVGVPHGSPGNGDASHKRKRRRRRRRPSGGGGEHNGGGSEAPTSES
jgi:cell fate regulator YaaT (PSP1 superfamily)